MADDYGSVDVDQIQHDDLGRRVAWMRASKPFAYGILVSADRAQRVVAVQFEAENLPPLLSQLPNRTGFVKAELVRYAGPKVLNTKMPGKK